jgi:hypothetical protein
MIHRIINSVHFSCFRLPLWSEKKLTITIQREISVIDGKFYLENVPKDSAIVKYSPERLDSRFQVMTDKDGKFTLEIPNDLEDKDEIKLEIAYNGKKYVRSVPRESRDNAIIHIRELAGPEPDAFEDDNIANRAASFTMSVSVQNHNFHNNEDADWIKFYGISEITYPGLFINKK